MEPTYETVEAIRAGGRGHRLHAVAASGPQNKTEYYEKFTSNTARLHRPGQRVRFRQAVRPRDQRRRAGQRGEDQFIQVVSCNTHNLSILIQTLALADGGPDNLVDGRFVCMRRANDISQDGNFVPSPQVGTHKDARFGTHHARDAWHLFNTLGYDLNLFSTAIKLNTQYMHTIFFDIRSRTPPTMDKLLETDPRQRPRGGDVQELGQHGLLVRPGPRALRPDPQRDGDLAAHR